MKKESRVGVIVLLSIIIIVSTIYTVKNMHLRSSHKFTIAKITKIEGTADGGGTIACFTYVVNGEKYNGSGEIGLKVKYIQPEKLYYIMFYIKNPSNAKLLDKEFIGDIENVPPSGWDEMPK
jgi:hypothetical protein